MSNINAAYNGDKPYVFISYAHKDSERVVTALEAMQRAGYRVWYDAGIEAGTEWSNNIAKHLHECEVFVAFISANSMASENCLDEIAYAKSHHKPSLMIFLEEDVVLPQGTEMQTARFQRMYFSRQSSMDSFLHNLTSSGMFSECIDASSEEGAVDPKPKTDMVVEKKKKRWPLIAAGAVVLVAIVLLCIGLSLGNGDSSSQEDVQMSDDPEDYTFMLEGVVYKLPFPISRLEDNGWTLGRGYNPGEDATLGGREIKTVIMVKDGNEIQVGMYNNTGNIISVNEAMVGEIEVQRNPNLDFCMAKGITDEYTLDEVLDAFGTPNIHDTDEYSEKLSFGKEIFGDQQIDFRYYSKESGYEDNSTITLRNFVYEDKTETNTAYPAYLETYQAPTELGTDLYSGLIRVEGDLYRLPAPVKAFLDNGWIISVRPDYVVALGEESAQLSKGGKSFWVKLINFGEYQTTPENCAVVGIDCYESDAIDVELPGIKTSLTVEELKEVLPDTMEMYESTYSVSFSYSESEEYEERDFYLSIIKSKETGKTSSVDLRCKTWDYE